MALRFASHLGFPDPGNPLFRAAVGSADPAGQIAFAAAQGFAGILDPFAAMRSAGEQARIGQLAADGGLAMGGFLYVPMDAFGTTCWGTTDAEVRQRMLDDIEKSVAIAHRLGGRHISLIAIAENRTDRYAQRAAMSSNLRFAGDIVATAGMTLCVEGLTAARLPQGLLHGIAESADVVRLCAHPAVRLLFDTAHCHASGEDVLDQAARHWDVIEVVQLADAPGRVEMGAGAVDFDGLFAFLEARGYAGLCELEHVWAKPGAAVQIAYVETLRARPGALS